MVFVKRVAAVLSVAVLAAWPGALVQAQAPDLILHNGKVVTVDPVFSIAEGVAIRGDRFVAVGTNAAVRRTAGPATRQIDLGGRTVIPGLMDGHLHNAGGGPGVDLSRVRSMAELLAAVEARAKAAAPNELIISNSDWHEAQLREKRLPHRTELDRVAPRNPVVLVRGGHEFIINTAAAARWNITRDTPSPRGGMKTLVDGGFEGGHMREPYAEPYGNGGKFKGIEVVPPDKYAPVVLELNRLGWRVATHAVGDAAVDEVLDAYEAADRERSIRARRWTIEHFFIAKPDHFP